MSSAAKRLTPAALQSYRQTKYQVVNEKSQKDGLSPILAAATNGHLGVVRCLVKNGANINDCNPEGQTPLILAAKNGYWPLLRLLVNYGAKLDVQDAKGRTALMHALAEGGLELARCLIDVGASQKPTDRDGKTALFIAAECGHVAMVEHLLMESGADLNARDRQGRTVLMLLARVGKAWPVHKYFKEGLLAEIINERDATGRTALLHAAEAGKFSMAGRLVAWGADTTAQTLDNQTVVMLACQRPQLYCAAADADFGAASEVDGAEAWNQKSFVVTMLERGVALDAVDKDGRTALFYAAECAEMEMVHHLLSLQSGLLRPECRDAKGNTLLHAASRVGRETIVGHLLGMQELAGLIDQPNTDADVPLRLAVMSKSLATVHALLESGASLEVANTCRDPPLICLASECGAEDIVAFLLDKEFDPDSSDAEGVTALMAATRSDHIGIVERLLKASASVNLFNKKGFTALTIAVQSINIVLCHSLLSHKADPNLLPDNNANCKTLSTIAATLDHCVLLDTLVQFGANPFLKDLQGRNALYYSVLLGRNNALKLLMKYAGPDDVEEYFPHNGQRHTLLTIASEKGNMEAVKLVLLGEPTTEAKSSLGESPLHIACRRQDVKLAELLVTYTTKPDLPRDTDQFTPLMIASQLGNREISRILCFTGADVNQRNPEGYTALMLSVKDYPTPADRVPLISTLLDYGAKLDRTTDEALLSSEAWNLLTTLCTARDSSNSPVLTPLAPQPEPAPQAMDQSKIKLSGAMTTEERLKLKLKKRNRLPNNSKDSQKARQAEGKPKDFLAVQARSIREEARSVADTTERNVRRLATIMKKHIAAHAMPQQVEEELPTPDNTYRNIEERLSRKPFHLSYTQASENKLLRDFSTRMDQIRKEAVRKFEDKLDGMCRRRPQSAASTKKGQKDHPIESGQQSELEASRGDQKRRRIGVQRRVLLSLKYENKAAKPSKGLRPVLLRRLDQLSARSSKNSGGAAPLSGYWERARRRKLIERHLAARIRQLTEAMKVTADQALDRCSVLKLEGLAVAVDDASVWWAPLPALSDNSQQEAKPQQRLSKETRSAARLKRTLAWLATRDCVRPTVLIRCGRRPGDMKLVMSQEDSERQLELSCAIQFQSLRAVVPPPPSSPQSSGARRSEVFVKLSVHTNRCLWDPRELRALSAAFAAGPGDKDQTTWERKRSLDTLTRRQTYHLFSPGLTGQPQEMESVALHSALSAKLTAIVLHSRLRKSCTGRWIYHGDDVVLFQQPSAKETKRLTSLLGPGDKMKVFEACRVN